nr:selenocysteine-specific translation elongation factor [Anaerolineaceae bacterium]
MHVIGTAGHVDHGKSTLIEALTGIHPDRLKEEKQREMTIDLGFGWLSLLDGREVGLVDVPGHIDFIGNLLSGIGGIDAVLFVIAANEGIMPQTREHEAIVRLLQIPDGIIVLTKTDLVEDQEWLQLIKDEIRELFTDSALADAPIVEVSAVTGQGIEELRIEITRLVDTLLDKPDLKRPRLPIDRVFQLPGIGTVVTGTLQDGSFSVGDSVLVYPQEKSGRIREIQTHQKKLDNIAPGNRVALNISGISKEDIQRGDIVAHTDCYEPTQRLDVWIKMADGLSKPLSHNTTARFYIGAKEVKARIRVLGAQKLQPTDEGFMQLELAEPVVAMKDDRFILRRYSPGETIGGGIVLNAHPIGRHKRFAEDVLEKLQHLQERDPENLITSLLLENGPLLPAQLCGMANYSDAKMLEILIALHEKGDLIALTDAVDNLNENSLVVHQLFWQQ